MVMGSMCRYREQASVSGDIQRNAGLVGHVHLNEVSTSSLTLFLIIFNPRNENDIIDFLRVQFFFINVSVLSREC